MDGETVTLVASGYPWSCPDCAHQNYLAVAVRFARCEACQEEFEVEALVHKIGASQPKKLVLTPASYSFVCTQCGRINYLNSAYKTVACSHCKAKLEATGLRHRLTHSEGMPEKDTKDASEKRKEPV